MRSDRRRGRSSTVRGRLPAGATRPPFRVRRRVGRRRTDPACGVTHRSGPQGGDGEGTGGPGVGPTLGIGPVAVGDSSAPNSPNTPERPVIAALPRSAKVRRREPVAGRAGDTGINCPNADMPLTTSRRAFGAQRRSPDAVRFRGVAQIGVAGALTRSEPVSPPPKREA